MSEFFTSVTLLVVLLNPFLVVVYLIDVMEKLDQRQFTRVLMRAGGISSVVFCGFAILGTAVFSEFMHAEFASFQIFGGVIFLLIGVQFVFRGPRTIRILRGESTHLAGAIAMPVLIGPGTISASVVIGKQLDLVPACIGIVLAVTACVVTIILLKRIHDYVRPRKEPLVERYIEIAGRITALFVGTIAIEMLMQGIRAWAEKF